MTTKQIDYCIELSRTLNFSRAAEKMFVSQPTLTYQIKLLEDEVGFAIFERSGKGAALTPAGTQFVSFLTGMREDLKRAVEQGQNHSGQFAWVPFDCGEHFSCVLCTHKEDDRPSLKEIETGIMSYPIFS